MFHIIVNPGSCSGRGLENWHKIEPRFQENGEDYKVYCSSIDKTIRELAAEITTNKMDAASKADASGTEDVIKLVVLGGDGSVNEAVNGIRDFQKTRLGFIPVGSGNDLSLSLGLPDDRDRIIDRILKGEVVRSVDIGELITHNRSCELDPVSHEPIPGLQEPHKSGEHWLFNISSGIGFDAAICQQAVISPFKKVLNRLSLGKLIYISVAIRLIMTSPMVPMRITLRGDDGSSRICSRRGLLAVCMNQTYEGGGFMFCPGSSDQDRQVDMCMAGDINRLNFFHIFPKVYKGGHVGMKGIRTARCRSMTIETGQPLWVHTDGEVNFKSSRITLGVYPEKLQLML